MISTSAAIMPMAARTISNPGDCVLVGAGADGIGVAVAMAGTVGVAVAFGLTVAVGVAVGAVVWLPVMTSFMVPSGL